MKAPKTDSYANKLNRLRRTLSCKEPDRVPLFELFWLEFLDKWQKEKHLKGLKNLKFKSELIRKYGNYPLKLGKYDLAEFDKYINNY